MGSPNDRAEPADAPASQSTTVSEVTDWGVVSPLAPLPKADPDDYSFGDEVARGGLGRVLRARDKRLGRVVALKVLLEPRARDRARFIREALITARLEHPSIVPIYEAGEWPNGEPYYAMKLVSGQSLGALIKSKETFDERLALLPHVTAVAEAIAYAHSRRVIHRDIKPSNVIIGDFGETIVIDWGLAKVIDTEDDAPDDAMRSADASLTLHGSVLGTPMFMPPEQARGEDVDERADVYALGAVLYTLLAGKPPFVGNSSVVLGEVLTGPPTALESREPRVPDDLAAVIRKAMARAPADRYRDAKELAADLRRFQTGQLVAAHRYSPLALVRRWTRQHRPQLAIAAIALLLLGVSGVVAVARIVRERGEAQLAQRVAEARANELLLLQAKASLERDPTASLAWLASYPSNAPGWDDARGLLADAASRGVARHVWRPHAGSVQAVAFAPDGQTIAVGGADKTIHTWDFASGARRVLSGHDGPINALAFSPDGTHIASASDDHTVRLWSRGASDSSEPRVLGRHDDVATVVAFSPDGASLASVGGDRLVRVWNVQSGASMTFTGHTLAIWGVAFSPDGKWIASGSRDKTVRLWRVDDGTSRVLQGTDAMGQLAFSPDGKSIAVAGETSVIVFDVASGASKVLGKMATYVVGVAFAPDGKTVATVGGDAVVRLWDVAIGHARTLIGHEGSLEKVAFSPSGDLVASVGVDGSARIWETSAPPSRALAAVQVAEWRPTFSPDGRSVVTGGEDGVVRVLDVATSRVTALRGHRGRTKLVAFSPDGRFVASAGEDKTTRIWDLASGEGRIVRTGVAEPLRLQYSPSGDALAVGEGYETLAVVRVDGSTRCELHGLGIGAVAFAPRGDEIAYENGTDVVLASLATCESAVLYGHEARIFGVTFSADGRWLASAGLDRNVGLWDRTTRVGKLLRGHEMEVLAVAFSPDGASLVSASFDKTLRVWDVARGTLARTLSGHEKGIKLVAFAPDGRTIVSASLDNTVRLWDPDSGDSVILREHDARINGIDVSPDGAQVVSADADGFVRLWSTRDHDRLPRTSNDLRAWMSATTTARIDAEHRPTTP